MIDNFITQKNAITIYIENYHLPQSFAMQSSMQISWNIKYSRKHRKGYPATNLLDSLEYYVYPGMCNQVSTSCVENQFSDSVKF